MSDGVQGEGYAISTLDEMGEGYGFRKIRPAPPADSPPGV